MFSGHTVATALGARRVAVVLACFASCFTANRALAQFSPFGGFNRVGVVGGVSVDADGVVRQASEQARRGALEEMRKNVAGGKAPAAGLRVVSLRGVQEQLDKAMADQSVLSEEVRFLAGLQRIEYVFVDRNNQDILIAGPAEGWVVREDASVVGVDSGRPVLRLEDLMVALNTAEASRKAPISVSIDPTPAGQARLQNLLSRVRTGPGFNPAQIEPAMRQAFGPQTVSLTTVDKSSRMAANLVAADYQMKRLAMKLEDAPINGLPSYMDIIRNVGQPGGTQPRWWLEANYDAIEHSADHTAWRLDGQGVKAMTEDEYVSQTGNRKQTGKSNRFAQQWADNFTEKFDLVAKHYSALGEVRNVMDLNVIATIIASHELEQQSGLTLASLRGSDVAMPQWGTPKTLEPQCSFVRGSKGWVVSASGGVALNPWKIVATQMKEDSSVSKVATKATSGRSENWYWD